MRRWTFGLSSVLGEYLPAKGWVYRPVACLYPLGFVLVWLCGLLGFQIFLPAACCIPLDFPAPGWGLLA